jgi:hypothetical protein
MSPHSKSSDWVNKELTFAQKLKKPIFPLLLEGEHWFEVINIQTVDVQGNKLPPANFFDRVRSKLGSEVNVRSPRNEVVLKSERGVDYTKLRDLLAAGKWKEADEETGKVMFMAAGRVNEGYLDVESMINFPCEDLRTINQLWLHYSKGKFGFSVQKEIYESLGGTRVYNEKVWEKFCDRVGWRKGGSYVKYSDLTFNLELASPAHLPFSGYLVIDHRCYLRLIEVSFLAQRLVTCNI